MGIDALILPDVPFEEKKEFEPVCDRYNIAFISFITPISKERIAMISKSARGFIYCVSSLGVTGVRSEISTNLGSVLEDIRKVTDVPCAIGFGISTPAQAKAILKIVDGVIVGSAIINLCKEHGVDCVPYVKEFVLDMINSV